MKLTKLSIPAIAATFLLASCALVPNLPRPAASAGGAGEATAAGEAPSLRLKLDWGRQVQFLGSDVVGATISVTIPGKPMVTKLAMAPTASPSTAAAFVDSIDISNLPAGDAQVHVDAFNQSGAVIGKGDAFVPLLIGRRSYVQVAVLLDASGTTDYKPLSPLGPLPTGLPPQQGPGQPPASGSAPPPNGPTPPPASGSVPPPNGPTPPPASPSVPVK